MIAIEDIIINTIKRWNDACKELNINQEYIADIKCRNKKFYLNKIDFYEKPIAEFSLYTKGDDTLLLWRKELIMPAKIKGLQQHEIHEEYKRDLYDYFLYECIGNFCIATKALITNKDYAEYDIEKDRLKADTSANGMVVSTLKGGEFYEQGNKFDVFMVTDDAYFVYTAHDIARGNNGIAKLDKDICMIEELNKLSIILL